MNTTRLVLSLLIAVTPPAIAVSAGPSTTPPQHGSTDARAATLVDHVRQATQPFLDVARATDAEYAEFLGCVSGPEQGAMGVHYVNSRLVLDGDLDVDHPEALIYEPRPGGLRLVGAEYIVLAEAWHASHQSPPVLEGQVFHFEDSPNRFGLPPFYELHVWSARQNPHGAFADWNTHVSCEGGGPGAVGR